jgi:hypothetical protein
MTRRQPDLLVVIAGGIALALISSVASASGVCVAPAVTVADSGAWDVIGAWDPCSALDENLAPPGCYPPCGVMAEWGDDSLTFVSVRNPRQVEGEGFCVKLDAPDPAVAPSMVKLKRLYRWTTRHDNSRRGVIGMRLYQGDQPVTRAFLVASDGGPLGDYNIWLSGTSSLWPEEIDLITDWSDLRIEVWARTEGHGPPIVVDLSSIKLEIIE